MTSVTASISSFVVCEDQKSSLTSEISIPSWFSDLTLTRGCQVLDYQEWKDERWRTTLQQNGGGGFHGFDFCHSLFSSVRILEYVLLPSVLNEERTEEMRGVMKDESDEMEGQNQLPAFQSPTPSPSSKKIISEGFPTLVGCVYFSPRAESHRGLCHGGSICAYVLC
jgi:hypothetical protein